MLNHRWPSDDRGAAAVGMKALLADSRRFANSDLRHVVRRPAKNAVFNCLEGAASRMSVNAPPSFISRLALRNAAIDAVGQHPLSHRLDATR